MGVFTANASAPRGANAPIRWPLDLTVTPPATIYGGPGTPGAVLPGEMLYRTLAFGAASLANGGTGGANAASFIGVSNSAYPLQFVSGGTISAISPTDYQPGGLVRIEVLRDGDHLFNATVGDVLQPGMPVYLGADGRTVQAATNGTSIGNVSPDQDQANVLKTSLTFGVALVAGQQVYVHIIPAIKS